MAGKFLLKKFADIDLEDSFFDSLKVDYPGKIALDLLNGLIRRQMMVLQPLYLKMRLVLVLLWY